MLLPAREPISRTIENLYRSESGRVLATLVRLIGDLDLAEEAMHEAFTTALETWPQAGIPDKPRPWLISTARFKAIDAGRLRRNSRQMVGWNAGTEHVKAQRRQFFGRNAIQTR